MAQPQKDWTNVSSGPVTLNSGRPLAPGEHGLSDMRNQHDISLRDAGLLVPTETKEKG